MRDEKVNQQIELEEESVGLGVERYRASRKDQPESDSTVGRRLIGKAVEDVAEAVDEWLHHMENSNGGAKKNKSIARFLRLFPSEVAAMAGLKSAVDAMTNFVPLTTASVKVATLLETHLDEQTLKDYAEGLHRRASEKAKGRPQYQRRRIFQAYLNANNLEKTLLTERERCKLGRFLLEKVIERTGLVCFDYESRDGRNRRTYKLMPTEEGLAWLEGAHDKAERMFPVAMPMVVQPDDWESPFKGGYLTGALRTRYPLVIRRNERQVYLNDLAAQEMPTVYNAINALQRTPWQVNRSVLEVFQAMWDNNEETAGLPSREPYPLPAKPEDIETNEEARKEWRREAAKVHSLNGQLVSKRVAVAKIRWLAERFVEEERIYFPYQLDWRSRAYPIPVLLQPQGSDLAKGLLKFADAKPLGERGAWWLKVHIANLFGIDKVPYADRVAWTEKHSDYLLDAAADPLGHRGGHQFWLEADDPWQALAACYEWMGYIEEGVDYRSAVPMAVDGTCSGLQHYSALLRDRIGGHAVNLTATDHPQDIYAQVAEVDNKKLQQEADEATTDTADLAQQWAGHVNRKLVKRPTMTQPYGVTQWGMVDQITQDLPTQEDQDTQYRTAVHLAKVTYQSIAEIVVAAREAMDWLRQLARVASDEGVPIFWETPTGFLVSHSYWQTKMRRIDAAFCGVRVISQIVEDTNKIDRSAMARGLPPNYVHSLDASHMLMVTESMAESGYGHFSMVHDSFGVHACDMDQLQTAIRSQFIQMYTLEGIYKFWEQVEAQLSPEARSKVPELPAMGELDLEEVRESAFFFS